MKGAPAAIRSDATSRRVAWTVGLLAAGYALKWADAQVVSVVLPQIGREFRLSDAALGVLTGLPFAIFYTVMGVPIARLADRLNRRDIVAVALLAFSGFTALAARSGSFATLFLTRIGVGVGEAGASPPAQSMIADLVPPRRRGFALSVYAAGLNVGVLFGFAVGGVVGQAYGWRAACLAVGLPGIPIALLTWLTLREPVRGASDGQAAGEMPRFGEAIARLGSDRAFRHLVAASSLASLAGFSALNWLPSFLLRYHGMRAGAAGLFLGLMSGIVGGIGALLAGWICDRAARSDPRGRPRVLAIACLLIFPSIGAFYLDRETRLPVALFVLPALLGAAYAGPSAAIAQEVAPLRMRATALSLLLLVTNLVGTVLGPMLTGVLSDLLRPVAGAQSLRWALIGSAAVLPWAAWHFWACGNALPAPGAAGDQRFVRKTPPYC